jgi:predicted DNA-binding transcriptional regulator YafY
MRASRLVSLLLLLQTRGRMTAQQLADEVEVSVRTIYRDMDSLSAAGVPIYADRGTAGGYQLLDGYRTRLTGLTTDEAASLFLTGMPTAAAELGLGSELAAAELKLMAALGPDLRERATRIRERFHLDAPGWMSEPDNVPHLGAVADAVWNQHTITLRYQRWKEPREVERTLHPLGIVIKAGQWYLVATVPGHTEPRTYRISRILDVLDIGKPFHRPAGFDLAAYWHAYFERYKADLYREEATIRLSPRGCRRARMLLPPRMAEAVPADDPHGWVTLTVPIESVRHGHTELLRLGADVETLEPPELRAMLTETAQELARLYGTNPH